MMMLPISGPGDPQLGRAASTRPERSKESTRSRSRPRSGAYLRPVPEADRYLGFIFARGAEPDDVVATLKKAHGLLDIVIR